VEVVDHLQHAGTDLCQSQGDRAQFFFRRRRRRRERAGPGAMVERARRREPERARAHGILDDPRHRLHVFGRRGLAVRASRTHHVDAHRGVRDLGCEVDVAAALCEEVEVFGKRLPRPGNAFGHHRVGDVLDPLHQLDEQLPVLRTARREADGAIAHHRGGHAV
jgi:hypothetical protein